MSTDTQIESEIQAKGLTAPRVTPADVDAEIASEQVWPLLGFRLRDRLADPLSAWANRPLSLTGQVGTMADTTVRKVRE